MFYWCWIAKSCVCLFAFVTGYGYSVKIFSSPSLPKSSDFFSSLGSFYKIYIFSFVPVSLITWLFPHHALIAPQSFVGWVLSATLILPHVQSWWYAAVFAWMTLAIAPAAALCRREHNHLWKCIPAILIACLPFLFVEPHIMAKVQDYLATETSASPSTIGLILFQLKGMATFLPWMLFGVGYYWLTTATGWRLVAGGSVLSGSLIVWCLFKHPELYAPLAAASVSTIVLTLAIRRWETASKILGVLGKYSVWMWLCHQFIFGYWFASFFYHLNPLAGYTLVVLISLLLSFGLEKIFQAACTLLACAKESCRSICNRTFLSGKQT